MDTKYKLLAPLALLVMFAQPAMAAFTGTYGFGDIKNVSGDMTVNILVGIDEQAADIGVALGIAIMIGMFVGAIGMVFALILILKNKGMSLSKFRAN